MSELPHVPHNLRCFVVEQDYEQYNEVDQAVWRFVLLQTYDRLQHTAHPAYREGLAQTGISVDRIPRVSDMSDCLEAFGWRAVCVDGFIPPRAFQEFQAASILPIAADMRSKDHLTYTPAPDIIHEAAGHAPILPDPQYAAYLRAIGEVGKKAFSCPADARVDAAIFELSEVKEIRGVARERVAEAEARLERALAELGETSEASRLSRLYWWTAEYGLVGTPNDYRLYGAGLLSSLWESHACHDASVQKLPLSARCVNRSYDITRPQPQLFVARDFDHLFSVLHEVEATLVHRAGGAPALSAALRSEELATMHFARDRLITGQLAAVSGSTRDGVLTMRGRVGLGANGRLRELFDAGDAGYRVPFGRLDASQERTLLGPAGQRVDIRYASGVRLTGELMAGSVDEHGQLFSVRVRDYRLSSERAGFSDEGPEYLLFVSPEFVTAHPGASDPAFFEVSVASGARVPKPRSLDSRERALLDLYEQVHSRWRERWGSSGATGLLERVERVYGELTRTFPDEWLLRWNLLECLYRSGDRHAVRGSLEADLLALEVKFAGREPIASGLRFLSTLSA